MERRYIKDSIDSDLANRMVFIGGPRQVGKTTLALSLLDRGQDESSPAYLNWDVLGPPRHKRFWQCHRQHARPAVFYLLPRSRAALKGYFKYHQYHLLRRQLRGLLSPTLRA